MGDTPGDVEMMGAVGADVNGVSEKEKPEEEVVFELSLKGTEFGDAAPADALDPLKAEVISTSTSCSPRTPRLEDKLELGNATFKPPAMRGGSKSSKRKRKNRRRREKNAEKGAAATTASSAEVSQSEGGRETEDTDTGGEQELSREEVSLPVHPTLSTVVEGTSSTDVVKHEELENSEGQLGKATETVEATCYGGPTHSVHTLLQIAKNKILEECMHFPEEEAGGNDFVASPYFSETTLSQLSDHEESYLVQSMAAPPSSPSSTHATGSLENTFIEANSERHKSTSRTVRFDERPPEVVPLEHENASSESEQGISNSTIVGIVAEEVASLIESSSAASMESAASLLKGNSSGEEIVECVTYHFPSRETLNVPSSEIITHSHNSIGVDSFREAIEVFKQSYPEQTQYLEDQVDAILDKSLDKFSNLVGQTFEPEIAENFDVGRVEKDVPERSCGEAQEIQVFNVDFVDIPQVCLLSSDEILPPLDGSDEESSMPETALEEINENETYNVPSHTSTSDTIINIEEPQEESKRLSESIKLSEVEVFHLVVPQDVNANIAEKAAQEEDNPVLETESSTTQTSCMIEVQVQVEPNQDKALTDDEEPELKESEREEDTDLKNPEPIVFNIPSASDILALEDDTPECTRYAAEVRQSVEIFSLNIPSQCELDRGEQLSKLPSLQGISNNNELVLSDAESELLASRMEHGDFHDVGNDDTDAECWLPERKTSLAVMFEKREQKSLDRAETESLASEGESPKDEQGCGCARMCIIM